MAAKTIKAPKKNDEGPDLSGGSKRLQRDYESVMDLNLKSLHNLDFVEEDLLRWTALIVPNYPPFDVGAFRVVFDFPKKYPFVPPIIFLRTKIYHPNINKKGVICLPLLAIENWKPTTRMDMVVNALVALIHDPDPDPANALRPEIHVEYIKDKSKFYRHAAEYTRKFAHPRPEGLEVVDNSAPPPVQPTPLTAGANAQPTPPTPTPTPGANAPTNAPSNIGMNAPSNIGMNAPVNPAASPSNAVNPAASPSNAVNPAASRSNAVIPAASRSNAVIPAASRSNAVNPVASPSNVGGPVE